MAAADLTLEGNAEIAHHLSCHSSGQEIFEKSPTLSDFRLSSGRSFDQLEFATSSAFSSPAASRAARDSGWRRSMPLTADSTSLNPRKWALFAAGAVFCSGFGALAVLYHFNAGDNDLSGLYTFRSATIGDGLLLPLLAYSLVRSVSPPREWNKSELRIIFGAGSLAALGGAVLQLQWLLNTRPRLNWTLPAPHVFNLPGWYHAMFLIICCGSFFGLAVAVWLRARREPQFASLWLLSVSSLGILIPILGFSALLAEDNSDSLFPQPAITVLVSAVLLAFALRWALGSGATQRCSVVVAASAVPAVALAALFPPRPSLEVTSALPALSAALVGAFCSAGLRGRFDITRITLCILPAICAAGPVYAASSVRHGTVLGLAVGGITGLALAVTELFLLRSLLFDTAEPRRSVVLAALCGAPLLALGLAGRYFAQNPTAAERYSTFTGVAAAILILLLPARAVRLRFDLVIKAEQGEGPTGVLSVLKWQAYLTISTLYSAAALSCVVFFMGTTPTENWNGGISRSYTSLMLLGAALVIMITFLRCIRLISRPTVRTALAALTCAGWSTIMFLLLLAGFGGWKQLILSAAIATIVGLFVAEGVISNIGYLHNLPIGCGVSLTAISAGLTSALTSAWMSGPAIQSTVGLQRVGFSLWALALGAAACILLPFFSASVLPGSSPVKQYVIAKPLAGVLQDSFLATLLGVSISWMANFLMAHEPGGDAVGAIVTYLALLSAAYIYVMKNNIGHVSRERKRMTDRATINGRKLSNEEKQAIEGLAKHVGRQNKLAAMVIFPIALLAVVTEISGFDREGFRQLWRVSGDQ
ncbi:hypothetical protein OG496_31200 [Streptomyces sp. NBC_00988]|uniref:hypothetical protein n=1 Tax=Streptomyces sp. NBC_00988 TaxID=2903704 RepID=UPI003864A142|nr:hypothetical protein OG496_31200 [Streptomyces sp. NBC_00988]